VKDIFLVSSLFREFLLDKLKLKNHTG